ncbi:MAG: hypothetical protein OXE95_14390 [Chloroflexi bacterium]|nr:hypothetical protein [Chloroflexota bacterium]MCY4248757.1 hypothetical protein [Chloroflexota bacterium]
MQAKKPVAIFIDTRRRRGFMYGAYAYASKTRLIKKLSEHGIGYAHLKDELALTRAIKNLPADPAAPDKLPRDYVQRYNREILGLAIDGQPAEKTLNADETLASDRQPAPAKNPDPAHRRTPLP